MKTKNFLFIIGTMVFFAMNASCKKQEQITPECTQVATYYSTATCFGEVAIDLDGTLLSIDNFSAFASIDGFALGDRMRVEYNLIQTAPEGLLCGPTVVADLIELTCFEKLD
jgi:hypothetical protein